MPQNSSTPVNAAHSTRKNKKKKTVIKVQASKKEKVAEAETTTSPIVAPSELLDTNLDVEESNGNEDESKIESSSTVDVPKVSTEVSDFTEGTEGGEIQSEASCTESFAQYQPFMYDSAGTDLLEVS